MKWKNIILWVGGPSLILFISAQWIFHSFDEPQSQLIKTHASLRDIRQVIRGFGYLESEKLHSMTALLPGKLKAIHVEPGMKMEKGNILFEIDNPDFKKDYQLMKAEFDQARLELKNMLSKPDPTLVIEARGSLEKATRNEEEISRELQNKKELFNKGFVSQKEVDELEDQLKIDHVEKEIALKRFEETSKPAAQEEIELKRAQVSKSKMDVHNLKEQWDARKRQAPFESYIIEILKKSGDGVSAEDSILTQIKTEEPFMIQGMVYESDVVKILKGQDARVKISGTDRWLKAKVTDISLMAKLSGNSRKFPIKLLILDKIEGPLRIGIGADYEILLGIKNSCITLPLQFIIRKDNVTGVWNRVNGKMAFIPIKLGLRDETFVEVKEGLKPGQEIVLPRSEN